MTDTQPSTGVDRRTLFGGAAALAGATALAPIDALTTRSAAAEPTPALHDGMATNGPGAAAGCNWYVTTR